MIISGCFPRGLNPFWHKYILLNVKMCFLAEHMCKYYKIFPTKDLQCLPGNMCQE